jgi:hypothetical protein
MVTVARAPVAGLPNATMSQSGLMVAALLGGFVVYLAMAGKLAAYWSILMGGGATSTAAPAATTTTPGATTTTPGATTTSPSATTTNPFGLPSSIMPSLGGTANPFAAPSGGTGTATPTGIPGLPNTSLTQFFGLGGG